MQTHPLIGITTYAANANREYTLPADYVSSVRRAGGIPILIAPGEPNVETLLKSIHGLILAGGGDIAPECYGGMQHPAVYMVDAERDKTELELAKAILSGSTPTLAICRGLQILNVALGGTLFEHLPDAFGEQVNHRLPPREPVLHSVAIEPGSELSTIMGSDSVSTMSWHHQGLRTVADSLQIVGRAEDGVVEAARFVDHPWLHAVQWHPELTAHSDPTQQRLFDALVERAKQPIET